MRTTISIILATTMLIAFAACKSSKKTEKTNTTSSENPITGQAEQKDQLFRLSVSFYSIGAGTDASAIEKFNNMLKSKSPQLKYEISRWGREGEINYCFQLTELKKEKQTAFINDIKKLLSDCQLVHIEENTTCVKGR